MTGLAEAPARPAALGAPPRRDALRLSLGVSAVSFAGPIVAALAVPSLAIAFWRAALASAALGLWMLVRHGRRSARIVRDAGWLPVASGALLALHFATWVPSLSLTSVASSTALVTSMPVWNALLARRQGTLISRTAWLGIGVALAGVVVITGFDLAVSSRAVTGDLLALAGAVFCSGYTALAGRSRQRTGTAAFTTSCYGSAAVVLAGLCLVTSTPLGGYGGRAWLLLGLMTAGPQLLGHSLFNSALRSTSATVVSLFILFEVPGAILVASVWLQQLPTVSAVPGIALLLVGVSVVLRSAAGTREELP